MVVLGLYRILRYLKPVKSKTIPNLRTQKFTNNEKDVIVIHNSQCPYVDSPSCIVEATLGER